jgi:hypothetical protein
MLFLGPSSGRWYDEPRCDPTGEKNCIHLKTQIVTVGIHFRMKTKIVISNF